MEDFKKVCCGQRRTKIRIAVIHCDEKFLLHTDARIQVICSFLPVILDLH